MAVELADAYVSLVPSFKGGASAISGQLGPSLGQAGVAGGKRFGSGFAAGIKKYGAIGAAAVGAVGVGLFKLGSTFDKVNDTIRVGTGATGKALDGLIKSSRNVGKDVPSNFGDIGTAIADLNTRLGLTGKPLENIAGKFLNLSRITGTDLSTNIADITRVFGDWAIETKDQPAALDAIFRASQATGIGIDQLSQKVVQFGAPLRQMGFGFEESLALFSKWEKEGVNLEAVMSGMRMGLGKLSKAGEDPVKAFNRITKEIQGAGSAGEANALAIETFGQRAGPDMAAAIREGRFELTDLVETITNGSETIDQASKDTASFGESWQLFKNRALITIEPIAKRVFDVLGRGMEWVNTVGVPALSKFTSEAKDRLAPALSSIGDFLSTKVLPAAKEFGSFVTDTLLPRLEDLVGWLKDNEAWLKPIAAGVLTAVVAYKAWTVATAIWTAVTKAAAAAQLLLNVAMRANPIGIVILALTGLAAGLTYAWKTSETFRNVIRAVFEVVRAKIGSAVSWIRRNAIDPLISGFQAIWNKAVAVKDGVVGAFRKVADAISGVFDGVTGALKTALNWVFRFINKFMISPLNAVIGVFGIDPIDPIDLIKMHKGGIVPGRGEVPRMLLGGEAVLNPAATAALGPEVINALNKGEGVGGPFDGWSWDAIKEGLSHPFGQKVDASGALGLISPGGAGRRVEASLAAVGKVVEAAMSKIASIPDSPKIPNQPNRAAMRGVGDTILGWVEGGEKDLAKQSGPHGTGFPLPAGSYRVGVGINGYPGHTGQDFPAPTGTPVFSPIAGFFTGVNLGNRSYGRYADVRAGALQFIGAHLSALVGASRFVQVGDLIGRVGSTGNSTGPHLHAEFRENGIVQDPRRYLKFDAGHGVLPTGHSLVYNGTGGPEPLVDPRRMSGGVTVNTFGTRADMVNDIRWALQVEANKRQAVTV